MVKTMHVAADRSNDPTKTVLPAEVARGVFMQNPPSLQALKLMHLMIATAAGRMADETRHEIRLADIRQIEGMKNHDRASITPLFTELSTTVLVHDDAEKRRVTIGGLLDEAVIDYREEISGDLLVSWWFGRSFRRMALESNHWAILDRQTVFHLGSKYAVLLFQHVASLAPFEHVCSRTFSTAEIRSLLGVTQGKLARFADLNKWALKPAIAEINHLSRLTLTATSNKVGRTVVSVTISWTEKNPEKKSAARAEMTRPRVGREARRAGTVETVEPVPSGTRAFPASGPIRHSEWGDVARNYLPRPHPDLEMVADAYRAWTTNDKVPRNEVTFSGFCRKWKSR